MKTKQEWLREERTTLGVTDGDYLDWIDRIQKDAHFLRLDDIMAQPWLK